MDQVHPQRGRRGIVGPVVAALAVAIVITIAGIIITDAPAVRAGELRILEGFSLDHFALGNTLALAIHYGFGPVGAAVTTVIVALIVWIATRHLGDTLRFVVLAAVPWAICQVMKYIVARPRPDMTALANVLVEEGGGRSFPSGHTAFAASITLAVVWIVAWRLRGSAHQRTAVTWVIVLAVVLSLGTALSRVYLGVHQPTDVIASLAVVPVVSWATARALGIAGPRARAAESA